MSITVIGAGYVGLVQGVMLANLGHQVTIAERSEERLDSLQSGVAPFYERGLSGQLRRAIDLGRIQFVADNVQAVKSADIVFLALPTPSAGDGSADVSIIRAVVDEIAPALKDSCVLVIKSTVPVGTTTATEERLAELGVSVSVASNPEFLREGEAIRDFLEPDRVVIGTNSDEAVEVLTHLYAFCNSPMVVTDPASAEMIKYASNSFLATKVTFANLIANASEALGTDAEAVLTGVGMDNRIGSSFLKPGPGFGGSCFRKDISALVTTLGDVKADSQLLEDVLEFNVAQPAHVVKRAARMLGELEGAQVAIWGLSFKAGTSDARDSPAVAIVRHLLNSGASVRGYDPECRVSLEGFATASSLMETVEGADLLIVATEWNEFAEADFDEVARLMSGHQILDTRNILDPKVVKDSNLELWRTGRADPVEVASPAR